MNNKQELENIKQENNLENIISNNNNIIGEQNQEENDNMGKEIEIVKEEKAKENFNNIDLNISSSDQFLELSLINEIRQTINKLELQCENKIGESVVEDRCRILSYALILVDVYQKPKSNLIYPYAKLGEAYYDIKYYEQAKEHIENAIKYNNDMSNEKHLTLPDDYYIRLTIKLSRCYLEVQMYKTALALAERVLLENKNFVKDDDISNIELYDIVYTCEKNLNNYQNAIENLKILYNYYSKIYDENSEKCINCIKEMALLYELDKQDEEALNTYMNYFKLIEELDLVNKNKIKEIYDTAIKIGELYGKLEKYKEAYDFLKKVDKDYNNGYNRTDKEKFVYQQLLCSLASYLDNDIYLKELKDLESFLINNNKNKKTLLRNTYLKIGDIYKKQNDLDNSLIYFKKALNSANKENDPQLVQNIDKLIKEIEKEKRKIEIRAIK